MCNPCLDCGETDWQVLQFDHRDPREKLYNVANMVSHKPWLEMLWEMEKCDVRCANCHTRKTALDMGYYTYLGDVPPRMQ
jgi:5-methylcytosine-specific restriction endonuclease McrA